jgi:hypothetical protein
MRRTTPHSEPLLLAKVQRASARAGGVCPSRVCYEEKRVPLARMTPSRRSFQRRRPAKSASALPRRRFLTRTEGENGQLLT